MSHMRLNSAMKLYYPSQNSAMKLIYYKKLCNTIEICIIIWQLYTCKFVIEINYYS